MLRLWSYDKYRPVIPPWRLRQYLSELLVTTYQVRRASGLDRNLRQLGSSRAWRVVQQESQLLEQKQWEMLETQAAGTHSYGTAVTLTFLPVRSTLQMSPTWQVQSFTLPSDYSDSCSCQLGYAFLLLAYYNNFYVYPPIVFSFFLFFFLLCCFGPFSGDGLPSLGFQDTWASWGENVSSTHYPQLRRHRSRNCAPWVTLPADCRWRGFPVRWLMPAPSPAQMCLRQVRNITETLTVYRDAFGECLRVKISVYGRDDVWDNGCMAPRILKTWS